MEEITVFFNVRVDLKVPKELVEAYKESMDVGDFNDTFCEMAFDQCDRFSQTDYEIGSVWVNHEQIY